MNTQKNPGASQHPMTSNEMGKNIYVANGELLNQPFNIVNSIATENIAHTTESQIDGSSQSWQNFHHQQHLSNHLVRKEIENNIEPSNFVQPYRKKTINDFNSTSVNWLLDLPKSVKKYSADHLQLNHRPPATTFYNNSKNYPNEISQLLGPTVAMFNDISNSNCSRFAQLAQVFPPPVPEDLCKNYIANNGVSNKQAIKLPPQSLPHFNGNPLRYHKWIKSFFLWFIKILV